MRIGILIALVVLSGCASPQERSIRQMRLAEEEVAGERRLFSTLGFWIMDDPLKKKILACYTADGALDRDLVRRSLPDAQIVDSPEGVAVIMPSGAFPSFLLRDGPLVSLDPKADALIRKFAEDYSALRRN